MVVTPTREPIPGLLIPGYRCCDCQSCHKTSAKCHNPTIRVDGPPYYVGFWGSTCGLLQLRPESRAAALAAEKEPPASPAKGGEECVAQ